MIRQSDIDALESVVLDGHGGKLIGEELPTTADNKTRAFRPHCKYLQLIYRSGTNCSINFSFFGRPKKIWYSKKKFWYTKKKFGRPKKKFGRPKKYLVYQKKIWYTKKKIWSTKKMRN